MNNASKCFLMLILISGFFTNCANDDNNLQPTPASITTPAELSAALESIADLPEVPGFAVTIVKEDQILYQQAFGKADLENGRAYTNHTTQPIGSISKTLIAAAVVKAIEQGHFTLETPINDILPFRIENPWKPDEIIKVKHLVTHTAGLLDNEETYIQAYHIWPGEALDSPGAQILQNGFGVLQRSTMPLGAFLKAYYLENGSAYNTSNFIDVAPGASWNYSNIASSLTAYLVEAATGTPFQNYVKANILIPLGMSQTAYTIDELNKEMAAKLYWDNQTPLPVYGNDSYPDGSINTNNIDLSRYLIDMMQGVSGRGGQLFTPEGYQSLFEALLPPNMVPNIVGENQGVFWFLEDGIIRHDGSDPGVACELQFDKTGQIGFLLMANMDASTDEHELVYQTFATNVGSALTAFIQANL